MKTLIKNARVLDPSCRTFRDASLLFGGERILLIGEASDEAADRVIDATGLYVIPGFIDVHAHGAFGMGFEESTSFDRTRQWFSKQGITTVAPTVSTYPLRELEPILQHILSEKKKKIGARLANIHLEGPFLSPQKRGAMHYPPIPCERDVFEKIMELAAGKVAIMTIAPELDGAIDLIRLGTDRGVWMSLGHTVADCACALAAVDAGACGATHTFNAMRSYDHREPGVLGAVLTDERVWCEMICDLVHLARETVKLILRAKGVDRIVLIDDAAAITGVPDGTYTVDGMSVTVKDGIARNPEGRLASSCWSMVDGARNLLAMGVPLADVCRMGSYNPAHVLGLDGEVGTLTEGAYADVLICDETLGIRAVFAGGEDFLLD